MRNRNRNENRDQPFTADFRFYEELNDFLEPQKQKNSNPYYFKGNPSIKDAIEAQGIPHTEVVLVIVNKESVGFGYHLKNGDRVAVYPMFKSIDVSPIVKIREEPLPEPRFILDVHLGKLARLMRLLGFDTLYRNDYDDKEIVRLSVALKRIVLTRDRDLLHARVVTHGYWVRSLNPKCQLTEIIQRYDLEKNIVPFSRCLVCNGALHAVSKEIVTDLLEPKTKMYYDTFYRCNNCGKIYWEGSHFEKLNAIVQPLLPGKKYQGL